MIQTYLACAACDQGQPLELPVALVRQLARAGCSERYRGASLLLYASADLQVRWLEAGGIVIGHLFDPDGKPAAARINEALAGSAAERLVRRYWGSYLAMAENGEALRVLRDPSGGLACYRAEIDGLHYFTSAPHLLTDCDLLGTQVDWHAVASALTRHAARGPRTALAGIAELLPGTMATLTKGSEESSRIWDPCRFAKSPPTEPAAALKEVLSSTHAAWARCYPRPLIEISGGLDSAIVAAGMAAAAPQASLITFAAAAGDADETPYARAIAEHLALPLEIAGPRVEDVDLTRSLSVNLPRPNARAFTQAGDRLSLRHGQAVGADAFASGGGGDDVFCYLRNVLPAIDRLQVEGVRAMLATAHDIAVMNHSTIWQATSRITRRFWRGTSSRQGPDLRFLAPRMEISCKDAEPVDARRMPGKADHVRGVLTIHNYLEGHERASFAPILSPLLSQPIVECCLSIPTWRWCAGGRNRAVARDALSGRLPRTVLERRSKGSFDGFSALLLQANLDIIRDMLLQGELAAREMLDREAIEATLAAPSPPAESVTRLLALVDVESWVQAWKARQPSGG